MIPVTLPITLTVNGHPVTREVEPRTHLADFLREDCLLTGTHIGCEHGVCGACTLLVDGEPVRSCIAFAAGCDGAQVRTIEDFEDDPVMGRLRAAFSAEHALQCGYCTPGMLATARDIVLRLPEADTARIRLELSGNLCRCTGYSGIVKAIARVLAERRTDPAGFTIPSREALPILAAPPMPAPPTPAPPTPALAAAAPATLPSGTGQQLAVTLPCPADRAWLLLRDPAAVALCLPGAHLTMQHPDGRLEGELAVRLGPIAASFAGEAVVTYQDAVRQGTVSGGGRDRGGSRAEGTLAFALTPEGDGCRLAVSIDYRLTGPLAQFGRGPLVQDFLQAMLQNFADGVRAALGGAAPPPPPRLDLGALLWRVVKARLARLVRGRRLP